MDRFARQALLIAPSDGGHNVRFWRLPARLELIGLVLAPILSPAGEGMLANAGSRAFSAP